MTIRPVAPAWLVALVLIGGLAAGVYASKVARSAGRTTVTGQVVAHTTTLSMPNTCLDASLVVVGDDVSTGDPLVRVRRTGPSAASQQADVDIARRNLAKAERLAALEVDRRRSTIDSEMHDAEMTAARLRGDRYSAKLEQVALEDALRSGDEGLVATVSFAAASERETDAAEAERRMRLMVELEKASSSADSYTRQCELCELRIESLRQARGRIREEVREVFGVAAAAEAVAQAEAALGGCDTEAEYLVLTAPHHGRVLALSEAGEGDADAVFAELADTRRRSVVAAVPAETAVGLSVEDGARLVFPDGERRTGTVAAISPRAADTNTVRVRIEPNGQRWPDCPVNCHVRVELD